MLKNENIICISSIDWDFIWQGHQEIMLALARDGNRVLFIENTGARSPGIRDFPRIRNRLKNWFSGVKGIRKEAENLYIFSPLILPFPYSRVSLWINKYLVLPILDRWRKVMDFNNPVSWVFLPTPLSLSIIENLNSKAVIYYCIDNFRVSSAAAKKIKYPEIKLMKRADLIFVTSKELYNYCSGYNDKVYIFPFAVNFREFEEIRLKKNEFPVELGSVNRPIIGYIGGIHKWLDLGLIKETAKKYPQYSFVFVGPIQTDISALAEIKNIYFLGKKEHKQIPLFINDFDACIIPYIITDYTKNVYPTKLNEYLALGKPVVSTALPEIINFNAENDNLVLVGNTQEEFMNCIPEAVRDSDETIINKRIIAAKKNSWPLRIEEMSNIIEGAIFDKSGLTFNWREAFLKLYNVSRKRILNSVFIILALYLSVFYTPLVWYLAEPLKISQPPRKADCIVVFAGGVGESGKAGEGYEERVQYAVQLYRNGYAEHIIFSSGYMYVFKEPLVMKALAMSLGVPESAIILEDKAKNTYENIIFTKEILETKRWNKILVISAPYHMRRVAMVFNKNAKSIEARYTSLPNSYFYSHPYKDERGNKIWKRISLKQIGGIFHEYLGILYYLRKGYI